jgi:hypothetical protein
MRILDEEKRGILKGQGSVRENGRFSGHPKI